MAERRPAIRLAQKDPEDLTLVTLVALGTAPAPSPSSATTELSVQGPGEFAEATGAAPSADAPAASAREDHHDDDDPDGPDKFTRARMWRGAELSRHVRLDHPEICENCG